MSELFLNVSATLACSEANGPGRRAVVWVQGCTIGCKGCFNVHTHPHRPVHLVPPQDLVDWVATLDVIEGVTVSGGEPFEQAEAVAEFLEGVRSLGLSTLVFSGYPAQLLFDSQDAGVQHLLGLIDLLCTGPYIEKLHSESLLWRGSSNKELSYLTDRYSPRDEKNWIDSSPVLEVTLDGSSALATGFVKLEGLGRVLRSALTAPVE